jgi:hypothetical protein
MRLVLNDHLAHRLISFPELKPGKGEKVADFSYVYTYNAVGTNGLCRFMNKKNSELIVGLGSSILKGYSRYFNYIYIIADKTKEH